MQKIGYFLITITAALSVALLFFVDPIAQDISYHQFADASAYFGISNALNVLSNLPYILVGTVGIYSLLNNSKNSIDVKGIDKWIYLFLFSSFVLVGFGSGYYHLDPNNHTLVWDRLPMTLAFMTLFSIIISEFISEKIGKLLLFPLLVAGLVSVSYWWLSESNGNGDLRFYAIIQFFPMLVIPIILIFFKSKYDSISGYWILLACYLAAKLFEYFDYPVYQWLFGVSGHSIKHLVSALGLYFLLRNFENRQLV